MRYKNWFESQKKFLYQKLKRGETTYFHMLPHLFMLKYFVRYPDPFNRKLVELPEIEKKVNGNWSCDIYLQWKLKVPKDYFDEIVEVQSNYYWNISFRTTDEGRKIVKLLEKEGYLSKEKAEDYRKRYLRNLKQHEFENKCDSNHYIGHISFFSDEDLHGKFIGNWEVNNECELERKLRHARKLIPYKKYEGGYEGAKDVAFISFAVPESDLRLFLRDVRQKCLDIGILYTFQDEAISEFWQIYNEAKITRHKRKERKKVFKERMNKMFEGYLEYYLKSLPDVINVIPINMSPYFNIDLSPYIKGELMWEI